MIPHAKTLKAKASYSEIRTLAFRLSPEIQTLPYSFWALEFPGDLKQLLARLHEDYKRRHDKEEEKHSIPIRTLNQACRALLRDLIWIAPNAWQQSIDGQLRPWLRAVNPTNPEGLRILLGSWIRAMYEETSLRKNALSELQNMELCWEKKELDFAIWGLAPNKTAKTDVQDAFPMIPDLFAMRLSQQGVSFDLGMPSPLHFRRVPQAAATRLSELVSWWPNAHVDQEGKRWYYSVFSTFSLQTRPGTSYPLLHCELGIRRWLSNEVWLSGKRKANVYFTTSVPWLETIESANTRSFQVLPIIKADTSYEEGKPPIYEYANKLGNIIGDIASTVTFKDALPHPQDLMNDPSKFLNLGKPTSFAVVHSNAMKTHGVQPGLPVVDRVAFAEQVAKLLQPDLIFDETPKRVVLLKSKQLPKPFTSSIATDSKDPEYEIYKKKYEADKDLPLRTHTELQYKNYAKRREAIAKAVGKLRLELLYDSEIVHDTLISEICYQLGIPKCQTTPATLTTPELVIHLVAKPLGKLGGKLNIPSGPSSKFPQRLATAQKERTREVLADIPLSHQQVGVFVEIAPRDAFKKDKASDPKTTLRVALAQTGRVNQFINPINNAIKNSALELRHRAEAAFFDLLRQLGVTPFLPSVAGLSQKVSHLGLWLVKYRPKHTKEKTTFVPVLVLLRDDLAQTLALTPGLDEWRPYSEICQKLTQIDKIQNKGIQGFKDKNKVLPYLRQTLEREAAFLGDTLLTVRAQNIRSDGWQWLQDGRIRPHEIELTSKKLESITNWPWLRVIRIREGDFECAEWYAQSGESLNHTTGLFQMPTSLEQSFVFASLYGKPAQFTKQSKEFSKLRLRDEQQNRLLYKMAWNAGIHELTVVCQPEDDPVMWATLAHKLRDVAIHHDNALSLPLPLHLASQLEEYVLKPIEEDD